MTYPADVLALEVDTSPVPNLIRNHSGRLGRYGIKGAAASSFNSSTDNVSIREGGFTFKWTDPSVGSFTTERFKVVSGTFLGFQATFLKANTGFGSVGAEGIFYDPQGIKIGASVPLGTKSLNGVATAILAFNTVAIPANAVTAEILVQISSDAARPVYVSRMIATCGATAPAATVPYSSQVWTDVLGKSNTINAEAGNTTEGVQDKIEPGVLSAVVLDSAIDPASNIYIRRGRNVRLAGGLAGARTSLWEGTIEKASTEYDETKGPGPEKPPRVTILATDVGRDANNVSLGTMGSGTFQQQVAYAVQPMTAAAFDGTESSLSGGSAPVAIDDSAKVADWLRRLANTYAGYVWVDRLSRINARTAAQLGSAPVVTFSDRAADAPAIFYTGISLAFGSDTLVNNLTVKRINIDEVEDDGAKVYGPYVASKSDTEWGTLAGEIEIIAGVPSAIATAALSISATPSVYPSSITFNALDDLAKTLALETYQAVRVKRFGKLNAVFRVLKITHTITPGKWMVTVTLRPLETTQVTVVSVPAAGADTGPTDLDPGGFPRMSSRSRPTAQAIPNAASTPLDLNASDADDGIPWDSGTKRWTVPKAGRYDVAGAATLALASATGERVMTIQVNGVDTWEARALPTAAAFPGVSIARPVKLAAGDTVALAVRQTSGGALNTLAGGGTRYVWGVISYIGP